MAKKAKKKPAQQWTWAPDCRKKPAMPPALADDALAAAEGLVDAFLRPTHVKPPPEKPDFNYLIDVWAEGHQAFVYFGATYACPFPDAISPTFELRFARLEHVGDGKFNLAYMRYTGKWWELETGLTLAECMARVRDGGHYSAV
jgi:hypothetical protein